jgi:DNA-binding HxlR family transcriptional regulator
MAERSYNQYCPIAHGLDLVGDRWSLLIVRDLLLGPKRFSDLREGLPGLGTNILTDRLKALERGGVIQRRVLPAPAASSVYELTAYGQQLEAPLNALARWGGQTLGLPGPRQAISRDSLLLTARALLRAIVPLGSTATYALELRDERFEQRILARRIDGELELVAEALTPPELVLALDLETLFALAGDALHLPDALEQGKLQVQGTPTLVAQLLGEA